MSLSDGMRDLALAFDKAAKSHQHLMNDIGAAAAAAAALQRAVVYAPPAAEELLAIDLCSDWMRKNGLDGELERRIDPEGVVRWRVVVHTRRGDAAWGLNNAADWQDLLHWLEIA